MEGLAIKNLFARMTKQEDKEGQKPNAATVLIVDDSRTQVHLLRTVLEKFGYRTLVAYDGEQGVDLAIKERPDIILMDIVMPNVNGFQATRMIRKNPVTSDIPVIIISGTEQMSDKIWGIRLGANDFLAKPLSRTILIGKMRALLNKKELSGVDTAHSDATQSSS
jgi:twitching motility two-component system response regulator PilH